MMAKEKEIGDPLENVARTGKLGARAKTSKNADFQKPEMVDTQKSKPSDIQLSDILESRKVENLDAQKLNTPDIQHAESPEVQTVEIPTSQTSEIVKGQNVNNLAVQTSKGTHKGRTQQTIYLPPTLAKKLRIAAVEEEREISEIVTEALEAYFKNKERDCFERS